MTDLGDHLGHEAAALTDSTPAADAADRVHKLLADDAVCNSRVTSDTVDRIAAMVGAPAAAPGGGLLAKAAVAELQALAALIKRPPLDDVLLEKPVALRAAAAIRVLLATPQHPDTDTPAIPEGAWRSIDSAPTDATIVDVWAGGKRWTNAYFGRKDHFSRAPWGEPGWQNCGSIVPDYWMPQPAAPDASDQPSGEKPVQASVAMDEAARVAWHMPTSAPELTVPGLARWIEAVRNAAFAGGARHDAISTAEATALLPHLLAFATATQQPVKGGDEA
jgi:hypothetical protein